MSETPSVSKGVTCLFGEDSLVAFLEGPFESETRLIRDVPLVRSQSLFGIDTFERWLAAPLDGVSIVRDGVAHPLVTSAPHDDRFARVVDAYRRGRSLLLVGIEKLCPHTETLCRSLEIELAEHELALAQPVRANGYLTPPGSRGFGLHYDDHCAVVLQLSGTKRWEVFPPDDPLPIRRCTEPLEREALGPPTLTATLHPGDVLYIPRGFPHWASTDDDRSLHLTLSISTTTWHHRVAANLEGTASLRRSVRGAEGPMPHHAVPPSAFAVESTSALQDALPQLRQLPGGRLVAIDRARQLSPQARLVRSASTPCIARRSPEAAELTFAGRSLRLPAAMGPVFDFLAQHHTFCINELPDLGGQYDVAQFVQMLVTSGLLELSGPSNPHHAQRVEAHH